MYSNDLPLNIHAVFTSLLFSDDTSLIGAETDVSHVIELSNDMFAIMNKELIMNLVTNNKPVTDMQIGLKITLKSFCQWKCSIFLGKAHFFLNINELLQSVHFIFLLYRDIR